MCYIYNFKRNYRLRVTVYERVAKGYSFQALKKQNKLEGWGFGFN